MRGVDGAQGRGPTRERESLQSQFSRGMQLDWGRAPGPAHVASAGFLLCEAPILRGLSTDSEPRCIVDLRELSASRNAQAPGVKAAIAGESFAGPSFPSYLADHSCPCRPPLLFVTP